MNIDVFLQTFIPELALMLSVCPVFIVIANISAVYGYRQGLFIALATFLASAIHMTTSALFVQYFISSIPKELSIVLRIIGVLFLFNLAYTFYKKDITKIKQLSIKKFDKSLFIRMFCFTSTCMVSISTNIAIFTSVAKNIQTSFFSVLIGAYFGAITGKLIIVTIFGTIGNKINKTKFFVILNKVAALLLCCYAILFTIKIFKNLFL